MGEEVSRSGPSSAVRDEKEEESSKVKRERKKKSKKEKKEKKKKKSKKEEKCDDVDMEITESDQGAADVGESAVGNEKEIETKVEKEEGDTNDEENEPKRENRKRKKDRKEDQKTPNEDPRNAACIEEVKVETRTTTTTTKIDQEDNKKAEERAARKRKREEKKQKKKDVMASIPKQDENGINYTKQQIRRMVRRVQRGLPPTPTAEEEAELKRQDAELRKEEELELAGMIYKRDENDNEEEEEDKKEEEEDEDEENEEGDHDQEDLKEEDQDHNEEEEDKATSKGNQDTDTRDQPDNENIPPPKRKQRKLSKKPVPSDYVCQACKNKHDFPHWIYDCPDKITVRGTNQVAAGRQKNGNNHNNPAPSAKKVFVSGLFFDTKVADVKAMFRSCGNVTSCKLLKFPDTGRCKGQAFVVFETEEAAMKALGLSGTKISPGDASENNKTKRNKKDKSDAAVVTKRGELELKVSKVMSRSFTKGKRQG